MKMEKNARIYVAGHQGMAGAAICRRLRNEWFDRLVVRDPAELDLTDQRAVREFFLREKPEYVFMAAGKVGGIIANNTLPAEFIYYNLQVELNVIHSAWQAGVRKLLLLGSSCTYPKQCSQPMKEEYLLTGALEPTSEPYALSKIAGMKMCQSYRRQYGVNYIAVIPADVYGPDDDFDPATAHVFAALLSRFHQARNERQPSVTVWGSGRPRRELFHADDLADACVFLMQNYDDASIINAGAGEDISIQEMAFAIRDVVGYEGEIIFDISKPDGMPRKFLDTSRIRGLGWRPRVATRDGIAQTYQWYLEHAAGRRFNK